MICTLSDGKSAAGLKIEPNPDSGGTAHLTHMATLLCLLIAEEEISAGTVSDFPVCAQGCGWWFICKVMSDSQRSHEL